MEVSIVRSNRKTIGICVNEDCTVTVRAPKRASKTEIARVVKKHETWIQKQISRMQKRKEALKESNYHALTKEEIETLADRACEEIPKRVEHFTKRIGVDYGRITIRNPKTRWGSCSAKGNLNFNCLLMLAPPHVIDYVVVHELCHRKEMNHSKQFWTEVARILPDYKTAEAWLKNEGQLLLMSQRK